MAQKRLKEAFGKFCIKIRYLQFFSTKVELNSHLNIAAYLNIAMYLDITKYLKIAIRILENVKLKNKDKVLAFSAFSIQKFVV